jgi:hypothetical protein
MWVARPGGGDEVNYTGAGGVRLVGEQWNPDAGHQPAGIALLLHGGGQTRRLVLVCGRTEMPVFSATAVLALCRPSRFWITCLDSRAGASKEPGQLL